MSGLRGLGCAGRCDPGVGDVDLLLGGGLGGFGGGYCGCDGGGGVGFLLFVVVGFDVDGVSALRAGVYVASAVASCEIWVHRAPFCRGRRWGYNVPFPCVVVAWWLVLGLLSVDDTSVVVPWRIGNKWAMDGTTVSAGVHLGKFLWSRFCCILAVAKVLYSELGEMSGGAVPNA